MTAFVVIVKVDEKYAASTVDAIHQSYGEEYVKDYLEHKMPAGSPIVIDKVVQV